MLVDFINVKTARDDEKLTHARLVPLEAPNRP